MTVDEMIAALKIKGSFPTSNDLFSNSDYLVLLNSQMQSEILSVMLLLSEEYFLLSKDYTIVQGSTYRIPRRAIGSKIRDVQVIDAGGNIYHPARWDEADRDAKPSGYFMLRNSVELSEDFLSGTLRLKYFSRPNKMVLSTSAAQIISIDTLNNQVTVSSLPSTYALGSLCDFVQYLSPYDLIDYDLAITGISGTTVSFSALPTGIVVGDYLCLSCEAPVPMLPEEMHPVLVQSALVACLSSKKDKAVEFEAKVLERMKQDAIRMLDPRVENNSLTFRSGRLTNYFTNRWY